MNFCSPSGYTRHDDMGTHILVAVLPTCLLCLILTLSLIVCMIIIIRVKKSKPRRLPNVSKELVNVKFLC